VIGPSKGRRTTSPFASGIAPIITEINTKLIGGALCLCAIQVNLVAILRAVNWCEWVLALFETTLPIGWFEIDAIATRHL
jgi:hypothetical protein